jgi:hypothetical protein
MTDPFDTTKPGPEEEALRSVVEDVHRRFLELGESAMTIEDWDAYHNATRRLAQKNWRIKAITRTVLDRIILEPIKPVGVPDRGRRNPSSPISSSLG